MYAKIKTLKKIISKWGISKSELAKRMPMSIGAFTNKINDTQKKYCFSDSEIERLSEILTDMASDIIKTLSPVKNS